MPQPQVMAPQPMSQPVPQVMAPPERSRGLMQTPPQAPPPAARVQDPKDRAREAHERQMERRGEREQREERRVPPPQERRLMAL
jgi:hypothetical protein